MGGNTVGHLEDFKLYYEFTGAEDLFKKLLNRKGNNMAGTRIGGLKARAKNLANDPDFYRRIGSRGGANGTTGGFGAHLKHFCSLIEGEHKISQCSGKKGGLKSKRISKDA